MNLKKILAIFMMLLFSITLTCCTGNDIPNDDGNVPDNPPIVPEETITFTFNSNNNHSEFYVKDIKKETLFVFPENSFTNVGYVFLGWSENSESKEAEYKPNDTMIAFADKTFYAIWQQEEPAEKYIRITLNPNGAPNYSEISSEWNVKEPYIIPSNSFYEYPDHKFLGWSSDRFAKEPSYYPNQSVTFENDIVLYAIWEEQIETITRKLTYVNVLDGREVIKEFQKDDVVVVEGDLFAPKDKIFLGWSSSKYSNKVAYHEGDKFSITTDLTLYAVYKDIENPNKAKTITFYPNGGEGETFTREYQKNEVVNIPINEYKKPGYVFAGWGRSSDAKRADRDDAGNVIYDGLEDAIFNSSNDIRLYAVYALREDVVALKFNPGSNFYGEAATGTMRSIYVEPSTSIKLPTPTFYHEDTAYIFSGYCESDPSLDGYVKYYVNSSYSVIKDSTLWCFWKPDPNPENAKWPEKAGQRVFFNKVDIKESDFEKTADWIGDYMVGVRRDDSNWYDVSQHTLNLCWAGVASNVIYWQLNNSKSQREYYHKYYKAWEGEEFVYNKIKGEYDPLFRVFKDNFPNDGEYTRTGINYFYKGLEGKNGGAYYKEVMENEILYRRSINPNMALFHNFVKTAVRRNSIISIEYRNMNGPHTITIWGVEYDEEGYICKVFYTNSADTNNNITVSGRVGDLDILNVASRDDYTYLVTDFGGWMKINAVSEFYDIGQFFEKYFEAHPLN